jgi:hypothetical protein
MIAVERLVWALEAQRGLSAMFGARISSPHDLGVLTRMLSESEIAAVTLDTDASHDLVMAIIEDRAQLPTANSIIILVDALASLSAELRHRVNQRREAWLAAGLCFVFAETTVGSPETLRELRDLTAVFRDTIDLRPDVGLDDHLWDTEAAASLETLASRVPAMTRGPTVIIGGRVHYKQRPVVHCPDCGGHLEATPISIRFDLAPPETAVQEVEGYRCACGAEWPEPRAMRSAHARAFGLHH